MTRDECRTLRSVILELDAIHEWLEGFEAQITRAIPGARIDWEVVKQHRSNAHVLANKLLESK